uniref:Uncharacterized protein MANES_17G094800 n=1 Tax=Rhizophora mucronata TaxID=61149 RepID=A0A2P2IPZ1_RHIMU
MREQQPATEEQQEQEQKELNDGGKRKLEDTIEIAKQKVLELASRFVNDADSKRPRLGSDNASDPSSDPSPFPVPFDVQQSQYHGSQATIKKITIPNGKVGVVIGKGGETIKYIQTQSGAKIQITKDQESDPHALTRDVDLMGTSEQISRAEKLINEVIAETDSGGSASSAVHGVGTEAEQFSMKVPNDKVGLLIGKGGETIKYMQSKSGARMQIIPLHLPPGDPSTERTVYINGSTEQIEAAKELVNDVMSGKRIINPTASSNYPQPGYPTMGNWGQPGQPTMEQQPQYAYTQPGNHPTPPPYYSNYPTQQASWYQSNPSTISQTPQQTTGYGYYGQQPQVGSAALNPSYSYSQTLPVTSNSYDQGYSQQPSNYGHNVSNQFSTYGQPNVASQQYGTVSAQSTQPASAYAPLAYPQSSANPQPYWSSSSITGQPSIQSGYNQTGYSQIAYGGSQQSPVPPSTTQSIYGQGGYSLQPAPAPANYVQGTHPVAYGQPQLETQQPQSQPANNGLSQPLVYGSETIDENLNADHVSNPAVQEAVPSQS